MGKGIGEGLGAGRLLLKISISFPEKELRALDRSLFLHVELLGDLLRKYKLPTQVNSDQTGWHDLSQRSGCSGSPVAALGYPTLVAESLHQFTPCESDAGHVPAGFGWLVRKSKSWKRRNDKMERIL